MLYPSIFRNNLFDDIFDDFMRPGKSMTSFSSASSVMKTDIKETDTTYELAVELPGISKENVTAELKDGVLTIKAVSSLNSDEKDQNGKYIRRERFYGTSSRSFYVGEDLKQEDIKAKFENGVLNLTVPKVEVQPKVEQKHYISIE